MYRLIACDLDETLLDKGRHVSKRTQETIKMAEAQGLVFAPATGRGFYSIKQTLEELDAANKANHYMIGFNGGVVVENQGPTIIKDFPMSYDILSRLFEFGSNYEVAIHLYTFDQTYVYHSNPEEDAYLTTIPHEKRFDDDIHFLKDQVCYKALFQNLDRSYLEQLEQEMPKELHDVLEISYSSNRYIEFNPKGVNKGAALRTLADHLSIPMNETIAIGDNINDLAMIHEAELGIAVANAVPAVKDAAQHTTVADHEQSAVAEVIETFIL
ncbi:Cof-type HAD-IIB family hydrolase [Enterococcus pseudoavium]|uniref:Cof-type HAD-IIB family hydrolase n=1 Tax=Enterococcus pseudoavium TaxID=44007 RepID=A0AAE4HZ36_9ENTE|nr:Cof-type HAD-IIB family hydrolase [Enterococcus pseudoavium]MDT2735953.1 Cof-type HAD-IIB family hydrolase [Enterococcus pseudoavium]MDT2754265.1 Cof-type HAD-IIB family hydrolase [Enterococcus pseudoavium]MDT2769953.1 Cof-type HAD-IIB family hydrolase [Enterococcus pseudoavium]